jgi:hypothetical protein
LQYGSLYTWKMKLPPIGTVIPIQSRMKYVSRF